MHLQNAHYKLEEENGKTYEADADLADYADLTASDTFDRVYSEVVYHLETTLLVMKVKQYSTIMIRILVVSSR